MKSLMPLPHTRVYVRKAYIRQDDRPEGVIEAYLVGVCVVLNEAPKLMVMTCEGAMFCYVPPHAVCFTEDAPVLGLRDVCAWDCLADSGEIVELDFARNFGVTWKSMTGYEMEGRYMFSLHFDPKQAWSRIPEQMKIFHFVHGDDENLHIVVNNQSRWLCEAITEGDLTFPPQSNMHIWYAE